jgi:hypothetical protein
MLQVPLPLARSEDLLFLTIQAELFRTAETAPLVVVWVGRWVGCGRVVRFTTSGLPSRRDDLASFTTWHPWRASTEADLLPATGLGSLSSHRRRRPSRRRFALCSVVSFDHETRSVVVVVVTTRRR